MCTENLYETEGGLSIGLVVSAGWRHITEISTSGMILEDAKSTITRERCEIYERCPQNTHRKPIAAYRLVMLFAVGGAT